METLLDEINQKDISIFSITDHDSIESVKLMETKELKSGQIFIPGVEISSTLDKKEYHINAYKFKTEDEELTALLKYNKNVREKFNKQIIEFFEENHGTKLLYEYNKYRNQKSRGGWKSLNFLIDKKLVNDLEDFFNKISNMKEEMTFLNPEKVIDIIHQAGGFAFLAHPASYYNGELLDKSFLKDWLAMGIDGIEAYSPYLNKMKDAQYYIEFCKENDLMYSSGSDCHGDFIEERKIGKPVVYLDDLNIDKLIE